MTALWIIAALVAVAWYGPPLIRRWQARKREEREGWQLVAWTSLGFSQFELRFRNGTVVRERHFYPSGVSVAGDDALWYRCERLEQQIEWGHHRELEVKKP